MKIVPEIGKKHVAVRAGIRRLIGWCGGKYLVVPSCAIVARSAEVSFPAIGSAYRPWMEWSSQLLIYKGDQAIAVDRQCGIGGVGNGKQVGGPGLPAILRIDEVDRVIRCANPIRPRHIDRAALAGARINGNRQSAANSLLA